MPFFTYPSDVVIETTTGHCVQFTAGVETFVPPAAVSAVVARGAQPVDPSAVNVPNILMGGTVSNTGTTTSPERLKALEKAIDALAATNNREDFSASGVPMVRAILRVAGFEPTARERDEAWLLYRQKNHV